MTATLTRLRPIIISIVVLIFTAGIAFAGKPSTPANGLSVASEASGQTVPVAAEEEEDEAEDEEEAPEAEEEAPEVEDAGDNCATDPTGLSDEELALLRHGSIVCWAAHQETPEGYANHGAWVSEWAKKNHGHEDTSGTEDETVSTESTSAGHGHGKSKNH